MQAKGNTLYRSCRAVLCLWGRRAKAALLEEEVPKLEKLVKKGKSVTQDTVASRQALVRISSACKLCSCAITWADLAFNRGY